MAVENITATQTTDPVAQNGIARSVKRTVGIVEVAAAASVSSTYVLARVPSSAKLGAASRIYFDDMATSGAPTMDLGLTGPSLTYDEDLINDGITLATVTAGGVTVIKDIVNMDKALWEIASLSSDPGEVWTLKGVIRDAPAIAGGTLLCELNYWTE